MHVVNSVTSLLVYAHTRLQDCKLSAAEVSDTRVLQSWELASQLAWTSCGHSTEGPHKT